MSKIQSGTAGKKEAERAECPGKRIEDITDPILSEEQAERLDLECRYPIARLRAELSAAKCLEAARRRELWRAILAAEIEKLGEWNFTQLHRVWVAARESEKKLNWDSFVSQEIVEPTEWHLRNLQYQIEIDYQLRDPKPVREVVGDDLPF